MNSHRREFSTRTKRQAWERANGYCEGMITERMIGVLGGWLKPGRCNAPLGLSNFHYDHIDPDWFSKDNELDNCQVLCTACHAVKTATDKKHIAKSKRIINKRIKANKKSKFRGWRKFDGTIVYAKR